MIEDIEKPHEESLEEFDAVAAMIKHAEKEGLLVEIVWQAINEARNSKDSIAAICNIALTEWDI